MPPFLRPVVLGTGPAALVQADGRRHRADRRGSAGATGSGCRDRPSSTSKSSPRRPRWCATVPGDAGRRRQPRLGRHRGADARRHSGDRAEPACAEPVPPVRFPAHGFELGRSSGASWRNSSRASVEHCCSDRCVHDRPVRPGDDGRVTPPRLRHGRLGRCWSAPRGHITEAIATSEQHHRRAVLPVQRLAQPPGAGECRAPGSASRQRRGHRRQAAREESQTACAKPKIRRRCRRSRPGHRRAGARQAARSKTTSARSPTVVIGVIQKTR